MFGLRSSWINYNNKSFYYLFGLRRVKFKDIGENVRIDKTCYFGNAHNICFEDNIFIGPYAYMDAVMPIIIKSGCMIGPRCTFISGNHNYLSCDLKAIPYDNRIISNNIIIEKNVWLGANVVVCPGTHIGEGAVIGAGTCVYGDIPSFSIVTSYGYKIIKKRDVETYENLKKEDKIYNKIYAGKGFTVY